MTRLTLHAPGVTDDELAAPIKRAKAVSLMMFGKLRAERISFAYGQLMDLGSRLTRKDTARIHDEIYGRT